jgi:asparagine synthetase B (glutamine-hydrolysing)
MCGIAGFTFKKNSEISSLILQKMIDTNMLRTSIRARVSNILFETPNICNDWFNKAEILRYWNEHQSGKRDHHRKIWALLVLFQITNKA